MNTRGVRLSANGNVNNWIKNVSNNNAAKITSTNINNFLRNAPSIQNKNFKPWFNSLRIKPGSANNINAVVKSARARAGLELYSRFKGFYINAHGFCSLNSRKFVIPKNKAVLFVAKSGNFIANSNGRNLERTLLRNNGRIQAFIQGSASILKNTVKLADFKGRLYLPGEEIYEHTMHFTRRDGRLNSVNNFNAENQNLKKYINLRPLFIGPSFGHIWRLPLPPNYSSNMPFNFTQNKNRILWNLPTFFSKSTNLLPNIGRYALKRQLQKLSTILRQGPPGVYIVGTCREDLIANNNLKRSILTNNFFRTIRKQNITNPGRVPVKSGNTTLLKSLPY